MLRCKAVKVIIGAYMRIRKLETRDCDYLVDGYGQDVVIQVEFPMFEITVPEFYEWMKKYPKQSKREHMEDMPNNMHDCLMDFIEAKKIPHDEVKQFAVGKNYSIDTVKLLPNGRSLETLDTVASFQYIVEHEAHF